MKTRGYPYSKFLCAFVPLCFWVFSLYASEPSYENIFTDQKLEGPWSAIFADLHQHPFIEATFEEERWIPMRKRPKKLKGILRIKQGQSVSLHYTFPSVSTLLIEPDAVYRRSGEDSFEVLNTSFEGAEIFEVMLPLFQLDVEQLQTLFSIEGIISDEGSWSVLLKPKSQKLAKRLKSVRVDGEQEAVSRFEMHRGARRKMIIEINTVQYPEMSSIGSWKPFFNE